MVLSFSSEVIGEGIGRKLVKTKMGVKLHDLQLKRKVINQRI